MVGLASVRAHDPTTRDGHPQLAFGVLGYATKQACAPTTRSLGSCRLPEASADFQSAPLAIRGRTIVARSSRGACPGLAVPEAYRLCL